MKLNIERHAQAWKLEWVRTGENVWKCSRQRGSCGPMCIAAKQSMFWGTDEESHAEAMHLAGTYHHGIPITATTTDVHSNAH
eukprot:6182183-Pleurochrysis_carterae.AAC.1